MSEKVFRHKWVVDDSQYKRGMAGIQKQTQTFSSSIKTLGTMMAAAFSVAAIGGFLKASLDGLAKEEQAVAQLNNSLKGRADITRRLVDQSKELSKITLYEDDAIIKGFSILSVFVKQEAQLEQMMPLVVDFAAKFGMDIPEAAKLVGKSVAGSAVAMKKLGIEVEGAAGSAERFDSVYTALNDKVGGAAVAAANTNSGAVQQLGKAWGEFGETLASFVGPTLAKVARGLTEITSAADTFLSSKNFSAWDKFRMLFAGMVGDTKTVGSIMGSTYTPEVEKAVDANAALSGTLEDISTDMEDVANSTDNAASNIAGFNKAMGGFIPDMPTGPGAGPTESGPVSGMNPLSGMVTGLQQYADELKTVQSLQSTFSESYAGFAERMVEISETMTLAVSEAFTAVTASFMDAVGDVITGQKTWQEALTDFANSIIRIALQMIATYLAEVMAAAFAGGASVGGPAAAATGAASAVGAGATFTGLIPALQFLAKGGIAYGPQMAMIGEYAGARTNPEVVAPLDKLESMIGSGATELHGKFVIQGSDLVYIVNKENSKYSRYK